MPPAEPVCTSYFVPGGRWWVVTDDITDPEKSWSDQDKTSCLFTPPQHINYPSPRPSSISSIHSQSITQSHNYKKPVAQHQLNFFAFYNTMDTIKWVFITDLSAWPWRGLSSTDPLLLLERNTVNQGLESLQGTSAEAKKEGNKGIYPIIPLFYCKSIFD